MPFIANTRVGVCSIDLNVNVILEELNIMLEKDYLGDIEVGSLFWSYVCKIEDRFNVVFNSNTYKGNFWDWFSDNYNNVEEWDDVEMLFEGETVGRVVIGVGYMSFNDPRDMLNQIVKCKNGCWKQIGDKTVRDLDGNLCITDDEYDYHDDDTDEDDAVELCK